MYNAPKRHISEAGKKNRGCNIRLFGHDIQMHFNVTQTGGILNQFG